MLQSSGAVGLWGQQQQPYMLLFFHNLGILMVLLRETLLALMYGPDTLLAFQQDSCQSYRITGSHP